MKNQFIINNIYGLLKNQFCNPKIITFLENIYFEPIEEKDLLLTYNIMIDSFIQDVVTISTVIRNSLKKNKKKEFLLDKIFLDIFNSVFHPTDYLISNQLNICKGLLKNNKSIILDLACYSIDEEFQNNILTSNIKEETSFLKIYMIHENKFSNNIYKSLSQLIFYIVLLSISSFLNKDECIQYNNSTNMFYVYGSTFNINYNEKNKEQNSIFGSFEMYFFNVSVRSVNIINREYYIDIKDNKFNSIILQIDTTYGMYELNVFINKIGSSYSNDNYFNIMEEIEVHHLIYHVKEFIEIIQNKNDSFNF
jgi:hypothetical protein